MNKILIIGSCGAGKSTLAKRLSKKLNLPLIGLDQHYWKPGWVRPSREEWRKKVNELASREKWIMDGNFEHTLDIRIPACDAVILFDINRFVCLWRILKRRFKNNRVDKLDSCAEKIDFEFIKWVVWDYPRRSKKTTNEYLKENVDKQLIKIKSSKDLVIELIIKQLNQDISKSRVTLP